MKLFLFNKIGGKHGGNNVCIFTGNASVSCRPDQTLWISLIIALQQAIYLTNSPERSNCLLQILVECLNI